MTKEEKINHSAPTGEQRTQSRLWPFIKKKCIFKGGQQMAQHLWSPRKKEQEIRVDREKERNVLVSFVFLVD